MSRYLALLLLLSVCAQDDLIDGFTRDQYENLEKSAEKFEFQAEVANLLDIIINSLYLNKEVFLRELISNSSDAMDKVRFMALQNPEVVTGDLEMRIEFDEKAKTLSITDKGVGMTKKDLVEKLGTVAKSGTTQFIEAIASGASMNLIGQFGVGFYSSFLVSDKVTVASKHDDDDQYIWTSQAGHSFTVAKDPRSALERGTTVTLHLKQDAEEFLEEEKIREVIKKYSEFVDYPIYLKVMREKEVDEPMSEEEIVEAKEKKRVEMAEQRKKEKEEAAKLAEEAEKPAEEAEKPTEEAEKPAEEAEKVTEEVAEDEDFEVPDPEGGWMKKVKKSVPEWIKVNAQKAIWLNDKKDNNLEDYTALCKTIGKDGSEPLYFTHFSGEGEIEFKAIIFFPQNPPMDLFENYYQKKSGLRVYVRRVLISEEYENLMPKYLNFLRGVVHSDDMPLNVSRESLQHKRIIQMISKKAVKKVLDVLANLADGKEEVEYPDISEEEVNAITDEDEKKVMQERRRVTQLWNRVKGKERYNDFWKDFGKNIKLGVIEDSNNRNRLAKLLRFYTTKSENDLTSFEEYIGRMPENQEHIYYLGGESKEALLNSPHIQKLKQLDFEVIVLDDALEEYAFSYLEDYDKKKLKNVSKGELDLGNESEKDKRKLNKFKELYKPLTSWWKSLLDKEVEKVTISKRLVADPVLVSTGEYGYTANMERISRSQAYANTNKFPEHMAAKKQLELNPSHPIIKKLLEKVEEDPDSQKLKDYAMLMYQTALLNSGFSLKEDVEFGQRMQRLIRTKLDVPASEPIFTPEVELDDEEESGQHEENVEQESLDEPMTPEEVPEEVPLDEPEETASHRTEEL